MKFCRHTLMTTCRGVSFYFHLNFTFSLLLFPAGADCKSATKGRESKEPGQERSRACSASSWYEAENKSLFS